MCRRRGFTLVELLLVVAIIVLIISMLLPALGKIKMSTEVDACQQKLKTMTTGFLMYGLDNDNLMFPLTHGAGEYWHKRLLPTYFGGDPQVLICPSATKKSGGRGLFNEAWYYDNSHGSYGLNLWFMPKGVYAMGSDPTAMEVAGFYRRMRQNKASEIPVFADSPWVGSWPDDIDYFPTDLNYGWQQHQWGYFMGRFCGNRHDMAINVGFLDTSARRVPLRNLWQLQWHRAFVPGDPH